MYILTSINLRYIANNKSFCGIDFESNIRVRKKKEGL